MDIFTIGSMIGVFLVVILGILQAGDIMNFVDMASVFVTVGGTILAGLFAYPLSQIKQTLKAVSIAFKKHEQNLNKEIDLIIGIANIARREGLLALEEQVQSMEDPFLKKGIMLIVDGSDPELIRDILETELDFMSARHSQIQATIGQFAAFAPAFGMLGTLIGLINMLKKLSDLSSLGPNMAVALITTFYGVIMANMIFTPIARKLAAISSQEYLRKELLLEGLLSIQDGENPRIIKDKLDAFIARSELGAPKTAGAEPVSGKAETQEL